MNSVLPDITICLALGQTGVEVWGPLGRTLVWATVIGLVAVVLAIPVARAFHAQRHSGWLLASMLLPPYMTSVALNALRGPGTIVGDWIEHAIASGWTGLPILLGKMIAGLGLALWAMPLAAALIAAQIRSLDPALIDALRMEPLGGWGRVRQWVRLLWPGLVRGWLAVGVLMTGSTVPLQIAQVQTLAISVWKLMDQTAEAGRWVLWLGCWPFVVISVVAGMVAWVGLRRPRSPGQTVATDLVGGRWWKVAGIAVWGLAAVVPVAVALWTVDSSVALTAFWRVSATAMRDSGAVAAVVGLIVCAACVFCAWRGGTRVGVLAACVMLAIGVFPGTLIGVAVAGLSRVIGADHGWLSVGSVVVAHVLRFGWIGCVVGVFLARSEPGEQRDQRLLEGAVGWIGWVKSCLGWQWGGLVAAGLAAGAMSFCEIESAIFVQPPELESLPRQMLGHLHYSRTSELGAASFYVGGLMLLMAVAGGWMGSRVFGWMSRRGLDGGRRGA